MKIINALSHTSKYIMQLLKKRNLLAKKNNSKKHEFFVSDLTKSFQESSTLFFDKKIILKENNIF